MWQFPDAVLSGHRTIGQIYIQTNESEFPFLYSMSEELVENQTLGNDTSRVFLF